MRISLLCLALVATAHEDVQAQMYRCTVDGATVYQQKPCAGGREIKGVASPTPEDARRARIELAVNRNQVIIGMTAKEVVRSWGEPDKINRSVNSRTVHEQWIYRRPKAGDDQYLYLENGILQSFQTPG
jgi:hypothetical protein